ncbi:MAG TPA: glycosyltransferase family 2 protein [Candidatus Binataceae bacterium]|nr:glycosyltransferase family 2 protein [Candidatus Binataceae bacterium]
MSVVILTLNEAVNLPQCLASLKGLDCEVFIVDSGSTDRTVEIARSFDASVVTHPFENYGAQRNWALENLNLRTPWVLHLDADERLSPALRDSIARALADPQDHQGFLVGKSVIFMGRQIRHGGLFPSYHLRLFRVGKGRCEDRLYDQHFMVEGKVGSLRGELFDVIASDLTSWIARHNRWSDLEVREVLNQSGQPGTTVEPHLDGTPIERRRWLRNSFYYRMPLFVRAFFYFIWRYFIRLGFLDGREGLIFHFLHGCWYRFVVDAKIYEATIKALQNPRPQPQPAESGQVG